MPKLPPQRVLALSVKLSALCIRHSTYFCAVRRKKKNIVLEKLLIEDYAAEGRSLARWNGKVVFVERTIPGDVVDVFLFKNKKDWAEGYPLAFHEMSTQRVVPFCP